MFSRSLLARSAPFGLSATLAARSCSRSLVTLRFAHPARSVVPHCADLRRFATAPAFRTETTQDNTRPSPEPSGKCYIANVPYNVTAEELKDAFSEFGKVESVKMLTSDGGLSRGVGFVHFESVAEAVNFVEASRADPIFVLDRRLFVEHAQKATGGAKRHVEPSDTLMVYDVQGSGDEVRDMFGSYAGCILAVRFDKKEAGQPSRRAFVQFRDVEMATEAMDSFSGSSRITYARQRQTPVNAHSLTSRLSQQRDH